MFLEEGLTKTSIMASMSFVGGPNGLHGGRRNRIKFVAMKFMGAI